jgi:hypothetical protein
MTRWAAELRSYLQSHQLGEAIPQRGVFDLRDGGELHVLQPVFSDLRAVGVSPRPGALRVRLTTSTARRGDSRSIANRVEISDSASSAAAVACAPEWTRRLVSIH